MLIDDLALAPNPQFARPNRIDLNGEWRFAYDDDNTGLRDRWYEHPEQFSQIITVPYPPESPLSGIGERGYHATLWYARQFSVDEAASGERQLLNFGAVDFEASVWVDGQLAGTHTGGHTSFQFDITDLLRNDAELHWIVVRAHDDPHDLEQPRGKQEWLPELHVIWYHRTSGIWQSVWLETVPVIRLQTIQWGFDQATWEITFVAELNEAPRQMVNLRIEFALQDSPIGAVTIEANSRTISGRYSLRGAQETNRSRDMLWSPQRPNLVTAVIQVGTADGSPDIVQSYMGLRWIELTESRVLVNGQEQFLRLVLQQAYWPESQLAAPSPEALEREAQLILDAGFNGARIHQKIEDPRFLYWADRKGLFIWGEAANAFTYSERAIQRHAIEWREAVLRDRNHPSIIAWVPFNESWGVGEVGHSAAQQAAVKSAYYRTHQLDGTRPVVGNDGWENPIGDIFTIHDYNWNPDILQKRYGEPESIHQTVKSYFPGSRHLAVGDYDYRNKPVVLSEFGGVSYAPDAGENWFGYGKVRNNEEFIEKYTALVRVANESGLLAGFCYTQFTDTEQETNGVLTEDREPKVPMEVLNAITSGLA